MPYIAIAITAVYSSPTLSREDCMGDQKSVLILEDEPIIALDLEEILSQAGLRDIQIFGSCDDAAAWLRTNTPNIGILDPRLKDGFCNDIAQTLIDRHIPFVVYSGTLPDIDDAADQIFRQGTWLTKPSEPSAILSAVRGGLNPILLP
jgi:DNA-binding NtrC family response regulator